MLVLGKRQGNIWECTVCGFMLTSFENMLLHIKYNHSSSTHTCPHCRIVVFCRSPKDAVLHQAQCKMRPDANSNNKAPETKIIRPALPAPVVVAPTKPKGIAEINAEVDKVSQTSYIRYNQHDYKLSTSDINSYLKYFTACCGFTRTRRK